MHFSYSHRILTIKERILSKSEPNQRFGQAYRLQEGTSALHKSFKVNQMSSRKLLPLKTGPYKLMRRVTDKSNELLSEQGNNLFAHRNHLIPF